MSETTYREQHESAKTEIPDSEACGVEGRRRPHKFYWVWDAAGNWTDQGQCIACGLYRTIDNKWGAFNDPK